MRRLLAACGGFLLAVLWFDLMFDVQVLGQADAVLPEPVLASIGAYYHRVTTDAFPMNRLVALVMLVTIGGGIYLLVRSPEHRGRAAVSLILAVAPISLAALRVFPNAVRLGTRADALAEQSALARSICYDHIACFAAIAAFVTLQLLPRGGAR